MSKVNWKDWRVIGAITLAIVLVFFAYYWYKERKEREEFERMMDRVLSDPSKTEFKQSKESKERVRRSAADYQIKLQQDTVDSLREMYAKYSSDRNKEKLRRAEDKLERLKEAEDTRRLQWDMMQDMEKN